MAVSKQLVDELHDKFGLPAKECRAALTAHNGDIAAALAALASARILHYTIECQKLRYNDPSHGLAPPGLRFPV